MNNKDSLAETIRKKYMLNKTDSRRIVDDIFSQIEKALENNEEFSIHGFGKFKVKSTNKRKGFNPSTREHILIESTNLPYFEPSKTLKDKINL